MTQVLPVTAAPMFGDVTATIELELPTGLTIAEIVQAALPDLAVADWGELRVVLVSDQGAAAVLPEMWHMVRPKAGVRTVIRLRPGGSDAGLRNVLIAVVSVAAMAIGAWAAPLLIPTAGLMQNLVQGVITAGITIAGGLLVQSLIPPVADAGDDKTKLLSTYSIQGWKNESRPGAPVPLPLGHMRMAPIFAAGSYTEIVNDQQFVRALFTFGHGRLDISDIRLGDTPVAEFEDVEYEVREGTSGDDPITLYPHQVIEELVGIELVRPYPRDSAGEPIEDGETIATPVIRYSASDATGASVIFAFNSGLFRVDDEGEVRRWTVRFLIEQQLVGASTWDEVDVVKVKARKREAFYRQYSWDFPSRGAWKIRITRISPEYLETQISAKSFLVAVQSIRPEYPLNFDKPLSLLAMKVRATYQLSGTLDNVNALVKRYAPVWNGTGWTTGLPRNPAAAALFALQSVANPYPVADASIDWDFFEDWYAWCDTKGLKYDRVHENVESFGEALAMIFGAGRAAPRHDGVAWGGVIDRPEDLVVDELNPRNSSGLSWSRTYTDPPDAFRVTFVDETNDYKISERIIPWFNHSGDILLTEELPMPGKTDPDEIWIEARRRQYEATYRPETLSATQDGQARPATRGDQVMASFDILSRTQVAGRVKGAQGALVELDEEVSMEAGVEYGIRFRVFASDEDTIGSSVVRQVETRAGNWYAVRLLQPDALPAEGAVVHFGLLASESLALKVRAVERGEDGSSVFRMVAAAPVIDTLTDAEVPPAWNARVGAEVFADPVTPAAPVFDGIVTGLLGTDDPDGLSVLFAAGDTLVPLASVRIEHKLAAAPSYTGLTVPAVDGGADITGYAAGDVVNLRLIGIASDATESPPSAVVSVQIGAEDPAAPTALEEASIIVTGGLGNAQITFVTGTDTALAKVQLYRVPTGDTLNRDVHAIGAPISVSTGATYTHVDGDGTRADLVANGGFDSSADWTTDANWSIGAGVATHATGAADAISQSLSLTAGETYRGAVTLSGATAGDLVPTLFGGTDQTDTAISANGTGYFEISAVTGNTGLGFTATTDFDGLIDDVIAFLVTTLCIEQGTYDYYLEPQNSIGGAGPTTAAFTVAVI